MEENTKQPKGVLHSKKIKAGKRTYFIDVKQTRQEDYYITLTESRKRMDGDSVSYNRNKILLYKEDFNKVLEGLGDTIEMIKSDLMPEYDFERFDEDRIETSSQLSVKGSDEDQEEQDFDLDDELRKLDQN